MCEVAPHAVRAGVLHKVYAEPCLVEPLPHSLVDAWTRCYLHRPPHSCLWGHLLHMLRGHVLHRQHWRPRRWRPTHRRISKELRLELHCLHLRHAETKTHCSNFNGFEDIVYQRHQRPWHQGAQRLCLRILTYRAADTKHHLSDTAKRLELCFCQPPLCDITDVLQGGSGWYVKLQGDTQDELLQCLCLKLRAHSRRSCC
mmetsp:Transcript_14101/g.27858  ORF Transcript_14101/g.27858 Transcript_14101/m.27858 type:complete len:200 (-) Transcript_14101:535-1134(-)